LVHALLRDAGAAICCVVVVGNGSAMASSSALQLIHPNAARDEQDQGGVTT